MVESKFDKCIILHNIRSAYNVGSVFRTADAAGVGNIYLTGYTPSPIDRFGREQKTISKTALGAEKDIKWIHSDSLRCQILELKKDGWDVVAVEQYKVSINYKKYKPQNKTAFVFGNEVFGLIDEEILMCDNVIEIPMLGKKESLNVAVAVGIILFSCGY